MEIYFSAVGTMIRCSVTYTPGWGKVTNSYFYWECSSEPYAGLAAQAMQEQLDEHIENIRKAAYESGWNDHKRRNSKRTDFSCTFSVFNMDFC